MGHSLSLIFIRSMIAFGVVASSIGYANNSAVSLAGDWQFRLDPDRKGIQDQWFKTDLPDRARLPGSTDENRYGTQNDKSVLDKLSRTHLYTGPAWYQREVAIPESWANQRITLFLERCHWETLAWLDDEPLGVRDSLCTPHVYELGRTTTPGRHRLTIRVDNTVKYNVGNWAHCITEETQTNWNGIVGNIELQATDRVWIDQVQVQPDPEASRIYVRCQVGNTTGHPASGTIRFGVSSGGGVTQTQDVSIEFNIGERMTVIEHEFPVAAGLRRWDEFSGPVYQFNANLVAANEDGRFADSRDTQFGLRTLTTKDKRILLNGRPIFLRGTLECCIFPLTGYPAMDREGWRKVFAAAAAYGLNHMRFHSWCPPEAAFAAADEAGFLLHIEAPQWVQDIGKDAPRDAFIAEEVRRICDTYGNHPSFGMLCMGNELGGEVTVLHKLVKAAKQHDHRHLYASATAWVFGPDDDYAVPFKCRGLHGPTTDKDFREIVDEYKVPCITHELGQWTVYPNLAEIKKYKGVLKARNFEMIRDDLEARHLLDLAPSFTLATGRQMLDLYKEEIESQLRTPNSCGFQLLDLHDFSGQGTALVGTLDAFWESKGLIEPDAFRRFCGPTVPLLRMGKRVFTTDETFVADGEIAHFGPADLANLGFAWTIKDGRGTQVASGSWSEPRAIPTGERTRLGKIETSLATVNAPVRLTVTISLPGTRIGNHWDIWVYPSKPAIERPQGVLVSRTWDDRVKTALAAGGKVLLLPNRDEMAHSLKGSFLPPFWSPLWFPRNSGSMSILCDPKHPALAKFPTDMYTNWQWYDLLGTSRSMILDDWPADVRPIVRVIDNFSRNHRLANLLEGRVGSGKVVLCSLDLSRDLDKRPVARQMLASLLSYMGGKDFHPEQDLAMPMIERLFQSEPTR